MSEGQSQVIYERLADIKQTTERTEGTMIEMRERLTTVETALNSLQQTSKDTATASIRMADIAEERARREREDREARRLRAERKEERADKAWDRLTVWSADNWKGAVLVILLFVNPASLGKLYELGLLAPFGVPQPTAAAPAIHPSPPQPVLLPRPDGAP